ncbi:Flavoprotein [Streptoalloteichus tenebrarius]|uniref:Flavoprotein n=1 Tax=Streptoalloteichus tenebrarius (strain ATCC 17920 / DSM 40477 / JCM 4838 / CBS 697.72 / NBRC 16177 / NCIMB 11028 / NRRL B-12390 / A12253. 1 / ISP 5477) TaxID=1933 RepID=A0ABT1HU62_STRSD|nr:flavoprotein [Streptoalloteichus tenebrarius]MCP2259052.1 Flavoprotein [Streptoalloteichus tenebrarius]BFE99622.1 hypothetical protein GCM10020241_12980 [Streptoalloteichus tenebrarius]
MTDNDSATGKAMPKAVARPPKGAPQSLPLPRGQLVLVGCGAFAVTQLPNLAVVLRRWYGCRIRACLTDAGSRLVARDALAAATGSPVWGPHWPTDQGMVPHKELADWADMVIVAPATANFVAKAAHGIADSLALSVVTGTAAPVFVAPAYSEHAFARPSTARNLRLLEEEGYHVVPTERAVSVHNGRVAEGGMASMTSLLGFIGRVTSTMDGGDEPRGEGPARAGHGLDEEGARVDGTR